MSASHELDCRRWLSPAPRSRVGDRRLRLFCFPHAGGTSHMFREWAALLPADVEVCPVQLPGRGARMAEPAHRSIVALVEDVHRGLLPYLEGRFAFFGHSMGAVVGFELARRLRATGGPAPAHVFVSAHRAPGRPRKRRPICALPDGELVAELVGMGGLPDEVAGHAELLALVLPTLRADLAAIETYTPAAEPALDVPITALGGDADPNIAADDLAGWGAQTSGRFALHIVPGHHFFVPTHRTSLLELLALELTQENRHASAEPAPAHHH